MNSLIALSVGLIAGAHSATWGMYKDAPYEGFTYLKYSRSIWLSGLIALVVEWLAKIEVTQASGLVVLYGVTYVIERAMLEFYKTFLRDEDQSKYFIPMQLHVFGRVVKSRAKRWSVGAVYMAGVLLVVYGIHVMQQSQLGTSGLMIVLAIGSVGGWISAFGGAWKDGPIEGFEILKFFRSPVIAFLYAVMLACFTTNYLFICFGALGYTIGTIETYKTFFFPSKPRGKFTGKPVIAPKMLSRRQFFVPVYVAIWLLVVAGFVTGVSNLH